MEEREVEYVKLDYRFIVFVIVIVLVLYGCYDYIIVSQWYFFIFDSSEIIVIDDEMVSKGDVLVSRCNFFGIDELEFIVDSVCGVWCFCLDEVSFLFILVKVVGIFIYVGVDQY